MLNSLLIGREKGFGLHGVHMLDLDLSYESIIEVIGWLPLNRLGTMKAD